MEENALKFYYQWKIFNFQHIYGCDLEQNISKSKPLLSVLYSNSFPNFDDYDFKFVLRLLPKFVEGESVYLSVFLNLEKCELGNLLKTKFKISIVDQDGEQTNSKEDTKEFAKENCFGFQKFVRINQDFLQTNQSLTLLCELEIENNENKFAIAPIKVLNYVSEINTKLQNIECKWSIDDFIDYLLNGSDKAVSIKSPKFFPNENEEIGFFIVLILDNSEEMRDYVSIYLYFQSEEIDKMTVSYQFSILDWKGRQFVTGEGRGDMIVGENGAKGCPKFIRREEILDLTNGLLSRNGLTISVKINCIQVMSKPVVEKKAETSKTEFSANTEISNKQIDNLSEKFGEIELSKPQKNKNAEKKKRKKGDGNDEYIQPKNEESSLPQQQNYKNDKLPVYNILLLGETGVGKSTTINAFANYLKYGDLETAKENKFVELIPSKFCPDSGEPVMIHSGTDDNERTEIDWASRTKAPVTYSFQLRDRTLRIIDTPGMGDTNGINTDRENFDQILAHLNNYNELHGILLLIRANGTRKTTFFNYCITELLTHLHRSASKNLIFCFTFSRNTFYHPGEGFSTLKSFLDKELKDVSLKLKLGENCFFIDNEAYRFLLAQSQGYKFNVKQEALYKESWIKSFEQSNKMWDRVTRTSPHNLKNTISLNNVRKLISEIAEPMVLLPTMIQSNICQIEAKKDFLENSSKDIEELGKQMYLDVDDLISEPLEYPRTVCTAAKCTEMIQSEGIIRINYKTICHNHCHCILDDIPVNTVGHPRLKSCSVMYDRLLCSVCGCSWQKHMHIKTKYTKIKRTIIDQSKVAEIKTQEDEIKTKEDEIKMVDETIQRMEDLIIDYEDELKVITDICTKFEVFLITNSSFAHNKFIGPYLDLMMDEELKMVNSFSGYSRSKYESLRRMKNKHQKNMQILENAIKSNQQKSVQLKDIFEYKDVLFRLKHTGAKFRQIFETGSFASKKLINEKVIDLRNVTPNTKTKE